MTTDKQTEITEIHDLIQRWSRAVHERDLPAILADHSADILMFDVPPPTQLRGIEAYERSWLPLFDAFGKDGTWGIRDIVVHAGDDVAFATALVDCVAKERLEVRLTVGLRKVGSRWTVVHEHHSVPSP
ncbi:MAG TPA: nuclear transport factor 2 family protein [Polyangiaceae bacterium]|nr:nuclear transport factor 2 family protein [Polyangiaceae bacterium]